MAFRAWADAAVALPARAEAVTLRPEARRESPLIASDPAVMMGKPVAAGTRLTVEHILEELAAGTTPEQLIASHPRLTPAAVSAARAFAARALRADVVYPLTRQSA